MNVNYCKSLEDVGIKILKLYSQNKLVNVSYIEKGNINDMSGMIYNIDFVKKEIIMVSLKKIPFLNILNICEIS